MYSFEKTKRETKWRQGIWILTGSHKHKTYVFVTKFWIQQQKSLTEQPHCSPFLSLFFDLLWPGGRTCTLETLLSYDTSQPYIQYWRIFNLFSLSREREREELLIGYEIYLSSRPVKSKTFLFDIYSIKFFIDQRIICMYNVYKRHMPNSS
jgi:hypothetical protein